MFTFNSILVFLLNQIFLFFNISIFLFYIILIKENIYYFELTSWITLSALDIKWEFIFDSLSSIMLLVIILISFCVHIYSIEYMKNDPNRNKFIFYLTLFTFFMIILVTAGNYLQLFIGWEGVGFCSYLLINFWYTRILANKAAIKALLINKIGDIFLLLGIILIYKVYGSLNFLFIGGTTWYINSTVLINISSIYIYCDYITLSLFLMVFGVCAKSAQIGLHTWLPDAMEGPTPVSALIHAATMVTAGIFLLLRSTVMLQYNNNILVLLVIVGGITACSAAAIGLFQLDIKKIIAYSTCSQLGYMVFSCGLTNYIGSFFHLMNHAFFKALLFLSAGAIIHSMSDLQDIRRMGNLLKFLPFSYIMIVIGSLALMGIPFLTGYYSKDFLLEWAFSYINILNIFIYWAGILAACLTASYSFKLIYLTFFYNQNSYYTVILLKKRIIIKENSAWTNIPLYILCIGSIFGGYFFKIFFIDIGITFWSYNLDLENLDKVWWTLESEFLPFWIKIIPFIITLISLILSYCYLFWYVKFLKWLTYQLRLNKWNSLYSTYQFYTYISSYFYSGYNFDLTYNFIVYKYRLKSSLLFKNIDKGLLEWTSVYLLLSKIKLNIKLLSQQYKSIIECSLFIMVTGLIYIYIYIIYFNFIYLFIKIIMLLSVILFFEL